MFFAKRLNFKKKDYRYVFWSFERCLCHWKRQKQSSFYQFALWRQKSYEWTIPQMVYSFSSDPEGAWKICHRTLKCLPRLAISLISFDIFWSLLIRIKEIISTGNCYKWSILRNFNFVGLYLRNRSEEKSKNFTKKSEIYQRFG